MRYLLFISLFFLLNSCSYSPNKKLIAKENLLTYNPKHFTDSTVVKKRVENENDLIIQAIFYEMHGNYKKSNYFYNILYDEVGGKEYLFRELTTALYAGRGSKNIAKLEEWSIKNPSDIQAKQLLISFYINSKKYKKAKVIGEELISKSGSATDFELAANPYILTGDYKEAVKLLNEAYIKTYNADILIKITTLLANYLGDIDSAINYLEEYRVMYGCDEKICRQLIEIYTKLEKIYPLIDLYSDLYQKTQKEIYAIKLVEGYIYTKDFDIAIDFLQNKYQNNELLYELYLAKKDYGNALYIANRLYITEKNPKWLAESAMALYESSDNKDDEKMLDKVVKNFENALDAGVKDSVYLNYYGYTLIDKGIDIEKGVEIIKDALKDQPDNSYYLDSLAWGYYKLNLCKEAYIEMKKVVDVEGLEEEDISHHWRSIQECNR